MQPFAVPKNSNLGPQKGKPIPGGRLPGPQNRNPVPRPNIPGFIPGGKPTMMMPKQDDTTKDESENQELKTESPEQTQNVVSEQKPLIVEKEEIKPTHERKFSFSPTNQEDDNIPKKKNDSHVEIGSNNDEERDDNAEPFMELYVLILNKL
mgnify:CR=1 FL=1